MIRKQGRTGCFGRVMGLAVLVVAVAGAWWWWNGGTLPLPEAIASRLPSARADGDSMSTKPSEGLATARWQSIEEATAAEAEVKVRRLQQVGGPSRISLEVGELASFLVRPFIQQLPASAADAQVALVDDMIYVRTLVRLEEFGGEAILGPLAGAWDRRDTLTIGGRFDLLQGQRAQFRIQDVVIGQFRVPRPLLPKLISMTRRGLVAEDIAPDAYPVTLPSFVGDVRINRNQITVYRVDLPGEKR